MEFRGLPPLYSCPSRGEHDKWGQLTEMGRIVMSLHPFVPLPNGVQVVIQGKLFGQTIQNVFYVVLPSAPGPTDVQGVAEDFESWFHTHVLPGISSDYTLERVTASDWTSPTGSQYILSEPTPVAGGADPPTLPNSVAAVISLHTALRGGSFRGRSYLAGIPEAATDTPNTLAPARAAGFDAAYVEIPGYNVTSPYALVIASFYSGVGTDGKPIPRVTGIGTPVNAIAVDIVLGNQRRRRPGRGI
jgi:hypothetical protein